MRTTEFAIEQVIAGLLVLAVVAIAFVPWSSLTELNSITDGAAVLVAAYLLGVLFDRFADTLIARPEQYLRLQEAKRNEDRAVELGLELPDDGFPEDRLRTKMLNSKDAVVDWYLYLRTRIRVVRATAVFLPAISFATALRLIRPHYCQAPAAGMSALATIYAAVFLAAFLVDGNKHFRLPRTDAPRKNRDTALKISLIREPLFWGSVALVLAAAVLVWLALPHAELALVATTLCLGFLLSCLAGWTWWRITRTQMAYLQMLDKD